VLVIPQECAVAFARRNVLLHLPLQVLAVILSAAKDPEEFNSPQPP
jgi:hypothetical protein